MVLDPEQPLSPAFREAVSAEIESFLSRQGEVLTPLAAEVDPLRRLAARMLSGGKRLRPAFCWWGYVAAAGLPPVGTSLGVLTAAASLDLLHVSALVHDDVMDASDLRRGEPAAHRQFEALHGESGWVADAVAYGRAGAILLGDLLMMWSVEMLAGADVPVGALARAQRLAETMRTEVTCGQYLDVLAQVAPGPALLVQAGQMVEYKSARYTVQRPCQIGAALGGGSESLQVSLGEYGSPLGRAFQFRDDVLGVFGDPEATGKPAGDDLREGKRTVLIAHAYARTTDAGRRLLDTQLGAATLDRDGVHILREVIEESGARAAVEDMITAGHADALAALDRAEMTAEGRTALAALAGAAVRRDR